MNVLNFPSNYVSLGCAISVVKFGLDDSEIPLQTKLLAIERVAEMETHNSVTKAELVSALRWLYRHYDFES